MALGAAAAFAIATLAVLPAVAQSLSSAALTDAAGATAADLRSGERKAALAKRLNPLSVEPLFAQASIAERGNQPRKAAQLFVDAVDLQPDNPDTWNRLFRFQTLLDDAGGAASTLKTLFGLDPLLVFQISGGRSRAPMTRALGKRHRHPAAREAPPAPGRARAGGPRSPAAPSRRPCRRRRHPRRPRRPHRRQPRRPRPTQRPSRAPAEPEGDPFRLEG